MQKNNEESAWRYLCAAVRKHYPSAIDIAPKGAELLDNQLPAALKSLYSETNGLKISGYLPDKFGKDQMTFSIILLEEVMSEYNNLLRMAAEDEDEEEEDVLWHKDWIPFAEDGGGNYQFIKKTTGAVFQYDCSFEIQELNASLENYFADVASRIESGILKPFNLD